MSNYLIIFLSMITLILVLLVVINIIVFDKLKYLYDKCDDKVDKINFINYIIHNIEYYKDTVPNNLPMVRKKNISKKNHLFLNKSIKLIIESKTSANSGWANKKEKSIDNISILTYFNYIYNLLDGQAIAHISGGSSGEYFYQWYTLDEYYKGLYGFIKCWKNIGWNPGKKILVIYIHGSNSIKILNYSNFFTSDYLYSYSPELNADGDIKENSFEKIIEIIENYKPFLIVSFPSLIYRISELIHKNNIKLKHVPKSMDLSGDFLFTIQYNFIKSKFANCDIRLSYGTIEFGQIAQQIPGTMYDYIVFDNICNVENYNENLVITNYLFTTQPIIRYITDDYGQVNYIEDKIIIKNLIGKNKYFDNPKLNYINIDKHINDSKYSDIIINLRIDDNLHIIYIIVVDITYQNEIIKYFDKYFNDGGGGQNIFSIKIIFCNKSTCSTVDRLNRKNTPII